MVIPNLCMSRLKEIEKEWENFIKAKGCPTINKEARNLSVKENGLGMPKIAVFWRSVRMAWLRRLTTSSSSWRRLHAEEAESCMFDPVNSTMDSLEKARRKIDNSVWRDIYAALLRCRQNILSVNPEKYAAFPINGDPDLTFNHCGIWH